MTLPQAALTPAAPFDFQPRTRLVFGPGKVDLVGALARELGGERVLLVTDPGLERAGHAARVISILKTSGLQVSLYASVRENPTTRDVDDCLKVAQTAGANLLIGLGGGSSMDTAKGCNFLLTNGGAMKDYWGIGKATKPMLPMIAIPTTAGTGSECQSAALIADEHTHQKMACLDPKAAARVALLDPALTVSQPARVTVCTGLDAMAHALETAVTRKRNGLSSVYSSEAFRLCAGSFIHVLASPGHLEYRGNMLLGAAFAGLAIESSMLGAAHSAANPLTAHFNVVHGHAVGLLMPAVIRYNAVDPTTNLIYEGLARMAGLQSAEDLARLMEAFLKAGHLASKLSELGVGPQDIPMLAEEASKQWTAQFNPRSLTPHQFAELYTSLL